MAEFVRERHHVARAAVVVQQQIGMRRGHGRVREGAGRLARLEPRIDPGPGEEPVAHIGEIVGEGAVGAADARTGLGPGDLAVVILRQRRVAVPVLQLVEAEPAGLERVVAVREAREGRGDGGDQRVDHLVLDHVGAVAVALGLRIAPPGVDDLLVLGERVGDQREQPRVLGKAVADRVRRGRTPGTVGIRQPVERGGQRQRLAVDRDAEIGERLVEQAVPGGAARHLLLVQQLLELVRELVRAEHPQVAQPRPPLLERGAGDLRLQRRILDPVQLEGEEDQVAGDRRDPLIAALVEFADRRVGRVLGEDELGVGHHPSERLLDALEGGDRGGEVTAREGREPALVAVGEGLRLGLGAVEIGLDLGAVAAGIEVGQVPGRQVRGGFAAGHGGFGCGNPGGSGRHGLVLAGCRGHTDMARRAWAATGPG